MRPVLLALLCGPLLACAGDDAVRLAPQQWDGVSFVVEPRPSPVKAGMNEFIVIATREGSKPGVGFVISLRVDKRAEWQQAIQDGYTGVYRRAVYVADPQKDELAVHIRRSRDGKEETTLYFPLTPR